MDGEHRSAEDLLVDSYDPLADENMAMMDMAENGLLSDEETGLLLQIAQQVKVVLQPVRMPMEAKRRLRTQILESVTLARSRDVVIAPSPSNRGLFIGAAVALAGGIAYLIHARAHAE